MSRVVGETEGNFTCTYVQGARDTKHIKCGCYVKEVNNLAGEPGFCDAS